MAIKKITIVFFLLLIVIFLWKMMMIRKPTGIGEPQKTFSLLIAPNLTDANYASGEG